MEAGRTQVWLNGPWVCHPVAVVERPRHRSPAVLSVLALAALAALALAGMLELALYLAPLAAIGVLLGAGVFVAEERIVAAWNAGRAAVRAGRRARTRWLDARDHALTSLLERSPARRRGPPVRRLPALN
jgi:hypothetical protein